MVNRKEDLTIVDRLGHDIGLVDALEGLDLSAAQMADTPVFAATGFGQCGPVKGRRALAITDEDIYVIYFHQIGLTGDTSLLPSFLSCFGAFRHPERE